MKIDMCCSQCSLYGNSDMACQLTRLRNYGAAATDMTLHEPYRLRTDRYLLFGCTLAVLQPGLFAPEGVERRGHDTGSNTEERL